MFTLPKLMSAHTHTLSVLSTLAAHTLHNTPPLSWPLCWCVCCRWGGQVTSARRSPSLTSWQRRRAPITASTWPLCTPTCPTTTSRASLRPLAKSRAALWRGTPILAATRATASSVSRERASAPSLSWHLFSVLGYGMACSNCLLVVLSNHSFPPY